MALSKAVVSLKAASRHTFFVALRICKSDVFAAANVRTAQRWQRSTIQPPHPPLTTSSNHARSTTTVLLHHSTLLHFCIGFPVASRLLFTSSTTNRDRVTNFSKQKKRPIPPIRSLDLKYIISQIHEAVQNTFFLHF